MLLLTPAACTVPRCRCDPRPSSALRGDSLAQLCMQSLRDPPLSSMSSPRGGELLLLRQWPPSTSDKMSHPLRSAQNVLVSCWSRRLKHQGAGQRQIAGELKCLGLWESRSCETSKTPQLLSPPSIITSIYQFPVTQDQLMQTQRA